MNEPCCYTPQVNNANQFRKGASLVVQRLKFHSPNPGAPSLTLVRGTAPARCNSRSFVLQLNLEEPSKSL